MRNASWPLPMWWVSFLVADLLTLSDVTLISFFPKGLMFYIDAYISYQELNTHFLV